jgi:hypothetical protein
VFIFVTFGY